MNKTQKELIKELNGQEIILMPYGAVGIDGFNFVYNGVKHKIDSTNFEEIEEAYLTQEYGTTDLNRILKIEGF